MRLFIAINFSKDTKMQLLALQDKLRSRADQGNFSKPDNLHLTLVFLGECSAKQTAITKNVLSAVCFEPFFIKLDRVGRFKRPGGDIWWVGVAPDRVLLELHDSLSEKLSAAGFALESRKYSPHITLGREVTGNFSFDSVQPFGETISGIDLMRSDRIHGELTYTVVDSIRGQGEK